MGRRNAGAALTALVAMAATVAGLAACTSGTPLGGDNKGLSNQQFTTPTSTPSLSVSPSPIASPGSAQLQAAAQKGCAPAEFVRYAGLAGGALRRYVAEPQTKGTFAVGAPGRVAAVGQAATAVAFASIQLSRAKASLKGCPTSTDRLESVIDQDRELLGLFAKEIKAGKLVDLRATAAVAMHENVVAQASLLKMAVKDVVPAPAQLKS